MARSLGWLKLTGMAVLGVVVGVMAGCRLYEPPRYERLKLGAGVKPVRVFMIGNSLTYYNDLPGLLQQMSAGEKSPLQVEAMTSPYASLKSHWGWGKAAKKIREGGWDFVVLQEFSRLPVTNPEESLRYFRAFSDEARKVGAQVIIFENWTRKGKDAEYASLNAAYGRVRGHTDAIAAPIGAAWRLFEGVHPEVPLLVDDRHPTDAGTYLAAAVLYDAIYKKKAGELPGDLEGPKLEARVKKALGEAADESVGARSGR